jgi:hypothetical protein
MLDAIRSDDRILSMAVAFEPVSQSVLHTGVRLCHILDSPITPNNCADDSMHS